MLNCSTSLAMSKSVLKALPGKLDFKRHSPSILCVLASEHYFKFYLPFVIFQPTHMADFSQVQAIQTVSLDDGKGVLQLRIAGASEPLTITCASITEAEDMADLIDGYCRLVHDFQGSFWTKKGTVSSVPCSSFQ